MRKNSFQRSIGTLSHLLIYAQTFSYFYWEKTQVPHQIDKTLDESIEEAILTLQASRAVLLVYWSRIS
jgi:hypothetical protein